MLGVVSSLILALHLLCMNLASAAPVLAVWLDRPRKSRIDTLPDIRGAVSYLAQLAIGGLSGGALLGLLLGCFRWSDPYHAVLSQFTPRIYWGVWELLFSAVLLFVYAAWVRSRPQASRAGWLLRSLVALIATTNLLYHFPPLFSMIAGVAAGHLRLDSAIDSTAFRRLLADGAVLSVSVHFAVASFAVAGTALLLRTRATGDDARATASAGVWGGRVALAATLLQIPVGLWMVVALAPSVQQRLMGNDPVAASLLIAAVLAMFWLLHVLAAAAFGDTSATTRRQAFLALVTVVVLMVGVLERTKVVPLPVRAHGISPAAAPRAEWE
ncbi:MAG: hypothetical protein AB7F89_05800 [Pirellulaceae bacterium]